MNKAQIVEMVAEDAGLTRAQASTAVDSVFATIEKALAEGSKVAVFNFGTFAVSRRSGRTGRNPQTGKPIKIPARNVARFKPAKRLSEAIN